MGTLYVVGTPIGNLGDMSPRGVETLSQVDFIAAEDTRVTLGLLRHFGLSKPMVSYYEHNIHQRSQEIITRLQAGESCAIVTDAGMPCISDPGEVLVRMCREVGIPVAVVPGPSAVVAALAVSGLATSRFAFEGFLTTNKAGRKQRLEEVANDPRTLLFYEAPHKLQNTLEDMLRIMGDRQIALCRELTKWYEEVWRGSLSQALAHCETTAPRGEYVLVLEGAAPKQEEQMTLEEAIALTVALIQGGESPTAAAKEIAHQSGYKKGDLYKGALAQK